MEEKKEQIQEEIPQEQKEVLDEEPKEGYAPRPAWQVWGARIGLVAFILFLIMYYMTVLRGNK